MGKVDCIVEMRKEEFNNGFDKAMLKMAKKLLLENFPVETVSRITELPLSEVNNLKLNLNRDS